MSDTLYTPALLRLAADAVGAGRFPGADAAGTAHNPACGDHVSVQLMLDEYGRIAALAHETKACVFAQASASILGAHLAGANAERVRVLRDQVTAMLQTGAPPPAPFSDFATLAPAGHYRNRHTCVLLPIDAVLNALTKQS